MPRHEAETIQRATVDICYGNQPIKGSHSILTSVHPLESIDQT